MAVQKRALAVAAAAISYLASRYAPQFVLYPRSFVWNAAALYLVQYFIVRAWNVVIYPHFFTPLRRLPQPPNSNWLLGNFVDIFKAATGEPQRDWIDNVENDGVIYYKSLFNEPRVLLTSPQALAEVLVQRNYEFEKPVSLRAGLGRLLGIGILLAEGDEHKRQRKAMMPAFSFRHIKNLYPIFWSKSKEMAEAMRAEIHAEAGAQKSLTMEIREWCSRSTLDIIGLAGMGQDFNAIADPTNELSQTYKMIFSPPAYEKVFQILVFMTPQWLLRMLPIKRNAEFSSAITTIKKVAAQLVHAKHEKLEKEADPDLDILSAAMESGGFTDDDLVNQLMTFLAAGHETTASAVTWTIYCLCKWPDTQKRLREELQTALPGLSDRNEGISSQDIDKLPYLNAVLNETMRIFPPVPLTLRETREDTTIQGHAIPKRTTVIICPWAINTSKHLWGDDARKFDPDRWMGHGKANNGGAPSNYAVTTFLHGPRSCIGKEFAKAESACLVAALVGTFDMELAEPDRKLEIQGGITARPKGGLKIKFKEIVAE